MATRITGKDLLFLVNGVERRADTITVSLESEELDTGNPTFAEHAAGGGRQWFIRGTALFDPKPDTLWSDLWDAAGTVVAFVVKPLGGVAAAANTPFITGNVDLGPKPNAALTAAEDAEFEFEFRVSGEPTLDRGESS